MRNTTTQLTFIAATICIGGAAIAQPIDFLTNDNETLYRGTDSGTTATFTINDELRGMSILENGVSINGANFGDVIAISSPSGQGDAQEVYRIDNAFSGTPALVQIGTTDDAVSDIAFANGRIFGVRNTGQGGFIKLVEFDTSFNTINTFVTDIQVINRGAGGLAYDPANDLFYLTDPDSDNLWSYGLGDTNATLIGQTSFDFGNNDLAMFNGTLYAGLADLDNNDYRLGAFNLADGSAKVATRGGDDIE